LKVGLITPALRRRGGIERVPVTQAKLLSESGYDVCIITSVYEKSCYPEILSDSKVEIRTPKMRSPILEVTVNTKQANILIDTRDSQQYEIVEIGSQHWMVDNLNYQ